jgi:hypothetical protein
MFDRFHSTLEPAQMSPEATEGPFQTLCLWAVLGSNQ